MEQVLKKQFWKNLTQAYSQSWRESIRWPFMLAIYANVLLTILVVILGMYLLAGGSEIVRMGGLAWIIVITGGAFLWLLCTFAIYICLDRIILRRIETMREGASQIRSGNFQHRLPIERPDELGLLAEEVNQLAGGLGMREAMLAKAHEKAVIDSQFKNDMLAKVSHDLRQPLGVILGFSEMIRDEIVGPVNNSQRRAVSEIISSTTRLSQMVTDLLDSSRMEAHSLSLRIDDFSPDLLLRQLVDQVSMAAERKELALITALDPALPKTLRGDPQRLLFLLNNLVVNAIKFTQQGSVQIRMFLSGPDRWAFSVADTGQGIPADALEHIFEPFWQANDPITRDKGGVGLGLSIVRQLVQLMDGHIQVESTVGVGSTFLVTLPLDRNEQ